jgi:signal peptidase I
LEKLPPHFLFESVHFLLQRMEKTLYFCAIYAKLILPFYVGGFEMKRIFAILVVALLLLCSLCACNSNRVQVLTDSMSPTFQKGDWVTYEEVDPATLKVGDVIVFEKTDGSVNVHRIVEIKSSETGELLFVTKADAVAAPDSDPVTADQIIGRAVAK